MLGVMLFLGNMIVTTRWKIIADQTRDATIVAFAQRQVTLTDSVFTALGVAPCWLLQGSMVHALMDNAPGLAWLANGRILIISSGIIWVSRLVPVQIKQTRLARAFSAGGVIPAQYRRLTRIWNGFGTSAAIFPLLSVYWMVDQPV